MEGPSPDNFSVIDLFTIGIGPSSSHTVGPMRAAAAFTNSLVEVDVAELHCGLYGSLADTGKGHGTDKALILGLMGYEAKTVPVDEVAEILGKVKKSGRLRLAKGREIPFVEREHLLFHRGKNIGSHTNAMHFSAFNQSGEILAEELVYSTGGGFTVREGDESDPEQAAAVVKYEFHSAKRLLEICAEENWSISEVARANELAWRSAEETQVRIDEIWAAMQGCIQRGLLSEGVLPGGLKVKRRAKSYHEALLKNGLEAEEDSLVVMDWVNVYALAVNEENAAGGRVVTAPTNGAAGVIPAVLKYATQFRNSPYPDGVSRFFLTAGAIGSLYKKNASISGADVGCQGEVGVACSMAAGALTEYLGGTPGQVEFAAEIGMEHNLGLTCDPIGGLVQIPCIERNAMGAIKAINASRLALQSSGTHHVSLDKVIRTMKATGADMLSKYKETARGGLAVNIVEC